MDGSTIVQTAATNSFAQWEGRTARGYPFYGHWKYRTFTLLLGPKDGERESAIEGTGVFASGDGRAVIPPPSDLVLGLAEFLAWAQEWGEP